MIERACALINELGTDLDTQFRTEHRATERVRLLRATTNRITRTANDAVQAYARARRTLDAIIERNDRDIDDAVAMRKRLHAARLELLGALAVASRRYPVPGHPVARGRSTGGDNGAT